MYNGRVSADSKTDNYYVWPVRSGSGGSLYNLAISKDGTGTGTVTSDPPGISCDPDCSESYTSGTVVTLTATPDAGSTFAGWSGDCSGDSVTNVTMDADKSCKATFTLNTYTITATGAGVDGGTIVSGSIINATWNGTTTGGDNTETVNYGAGPYTITATATVAGVNVTWSGDCDATTDNGTTIANCTINAGIAVDKNITATFALNQHTVTPSAGAHGSISPNTAQTVAHGNTIQFTVMPNPGYTASVVGTCGGNLVDNTYTTNPITSDCTVVATFTLTTSVTIQAATGNGNITIETSTSGCGIYNVSSKTEAQVGNDPSYDYPYGLLEFRLNCTDAYVTITYPNNIPTTYRKYGPTTPGNPNTTKWYTFTDVTYPSGNKVTLHLQDGQLGDDTGADEIIVDQGGPGQSPQQAVAVPTMTEWGMIIFMILAGLGSVYYLRRGYRS